MDKIRLKQGASHKYYDITQMNKITNLNIRIDKDLRDRFNEICATRRTTAAAKLRELIFDYVNDYEQFRDKC
jgi:predicted DNA-binding protein